MSIPDGFEKAGVIGVDAGLCWIGDPCYILSEDADTKFDNWSDFCAQHEKNEKKGAAQFNYKLGHPGLGVCVGTGHGDGTYDVLVRREGNRVMEVRVVFDYDIDDSDESDDEG